jgi:hypothetical protein
MQHKYYVVQHTYFPSVSLENCTVRHRMEKRPEGAIAAPIVEIVKLSLWDMNCYHLIENEKRNTEVDLWSECYLLHVAVPEKQLSYIA